MLKRADSEQPAYSSQEELMALREGFTDGLKDALAGYFQANEVSVQQLEQLSKVVYDLLRSVDLASKALPQGGSQNGRY